MTAQRRQGRRSLAEISSRLSERDVTVLRLLADVRLATARHLEQIVFTEGSPLTRARRTRRTLTRLHEWGLITRLERRIGGVRAGSAGYVYRLGSPGKRILGIPTHGQREPSFSFVDHTLSIVDTHAELQAAHLAGRIEELRIAHEPETWRAFSGLQGQRTILKPDMHAAWAAGELEHLWFIEIDRDTEHRPALTVKCRQYLGYLATGIEQHRTGTFPKVLWSVPTQRRADQLQDLIEGLPAPGPDLFTVAITINTLAALIGETTPKGGEHANSNPDT